jgi:hypothetical protein
VGVASGPKPWHHAGVKKAAAPTKPKTSKATKPSASAGAKSRPPAKKMAPRSDLGAPVDGFFAKQPPPLRPILDRLRLLVEQAAPAATSSIKWGMPFYELDGEIVCALAGFKAHVNLILPGPPGTYADPGRLLQGEGKTGRHLKVRTLDELPDAAVRGWLRTAAARARKAAVS